MVSGFESGEPEARLGAGWQISTDEMMGGSSTAPLHVVPFSALPGIDGSGLGAVLFSAGSEPGGFRFRIDEVRFVEEGGGASADEGRR